MNKTEFKKIVGNKLKENGFSFEQKRTICEQIQL